MHLIRDTLKKKHQAGHVDIIPSIIEADFTYQLFVSELEILKDSKLSGQLTVAQTDVFDIAEIVQFIFMLLRQDARQVF